MNCRAGAFQKKFSPISSIFTFKHLSMTLKMRVLGYYIFPVFSFGSEAWTLTKLMENKINAFEMRSLRRLGGVSWKDWKTSDEVFKAAENRP